jgi:endo-1,4-beta-xylanase
MPLVPAFRGRFALTLLAFSCPLFAESTPPPIPSTPAHEIDHPASIALWPNGAPGFEGKKDTKESVDWRQEPDIVFPVTSGIHNPSITPYLPARGKASGAAVIIAPGGGHMFLTMDREGYDLGQWLADHGVAAFVLKYRLARDQSNPKGTPQPYTIDNQALADAQRAIRVIRSRSKEWGVNPARVGILGFSAGGEVALLAATHFDAGKADAADPVERLSSRPDFFAPVYPGGLQRTDLTLSKETPPAFLLCAFDDRMPEQLSQFFIALKKAGVNAELHIYNSGGHGFGVRDRPIAVSHWPQRFVEWMGDLGLLKP